MVRTTQSDLYAALRALQRATGTEERESPYLSLSHSPQGWKVVEIDTRTMGERDVFGARRRPAGEMLNTMQFAINVTEYERRRSPSSQSSAVTAARGTTVKPAIASRVILNERQAYCVCSECADTLEMLVGSYPIPGRLEFEELTGMPCQVREMVESISNDNTRALAKSLFSIFGTDRS